MVIIIIFNTLEGKISGKGKEGLEIANPIWTCPKMQNITPC